MYLHQRKKALSSTKTVQRKGKSLFPPTDSSNELPIQMLISSERFAKLANDRGYGFFMGLFEPEIKHITALISEYHSINSSRKSNSYKRMNSLRVLREIELECYKWIGQHPLEASRGILVTKPMDELIYPLLREVESHVHQEILFAQTSDVPLWMEGMGKVTAEHYYLSKEPKWTDAQNLWRMIVSNNTTLKIFDATTTEEEKERSLERTLAMSINPHAGWGDAFAQHQKLLASTQGWQLETMSVPTSSTSHQAETSPSASLPPGAVKPEDEVRSKPLTQFHESFHQTWDKSQLDFKKRIQIAIGRLMMTPEGRDLLNHIAHFGRQAGIYPPVFLEENTTPDADGVLRNKITLPRQKKLNLFEEEKVTMEEIRTEKKRREDLVDISFVPRATPDMDSRVSIKLTDDFSQTEYPFCPSTKPSPGHTYYKYEARDKTGPITPYLDYLNLGIYLHAISELHTRKYLFKYQEKHSQGKFENPVRERMGLPVVTDFGILKDFSFKPIS